MIAYRIQDKNRGVEYLLDPETQYSWPSDEDESKVRHGVSGCETIEELAAYWTTYSSEAWDPVLVRVEGPESEDCPSTGSSGRSWSCLIPLRSLRTTCVVPDQLPDRPLRRGLHTDPRSACGKG